MAFTRDTLPDDPLPKDPAQTPKAPKIDQDAVATLTASFLAKEGKTGVFNKFGEVFTQRLNAGDDLQTSFAKALNAAGVKGDKLESRLHNCDDACKDAGINKEALRTQMKELEIGFDRSKTFGAVEKGEDVSKILDDIKSGKLPAAEQMPQQNLPSPTIAAIGSPEKGGRGTPA